MVDLTLGILMVLGDNRSHIYQSRPWLLRVLDSDMVLSSSLVLGPYCSMVPKFQQGCRPVAQIL